MKTALERVHDKAVALWEKEGILNEGVTVSAGPLTVEQAIGAPEGDDFPIQQGKEKLMEASFRKARGQAFTDHYGRWAGTLAEAAGLSLENNFNRAVFVSALNAVSASLGLAQGAVHCRNEGPKLCAQKICDHIRRDYDARRVGIIGFQPTLAQAVSGVFEARLVDMDPDNIGETKRGVLIEDAAATGEIVDWCDLLLVTGTTLANDTIDAFLTDKPVLFYGTTICGGASLMGWDRFCPQSS